ncbi:hypothetical protein N9937_01995 [bacterium]|nr:hypothetical protein [bacterium]
MTTIANPYNARKDYDNEETVERGLVSADDALATAPTETETETMDESAVSEKPKGGDKPYKKVDYKKRYDSLKKHYDSKVNEMKQQQETLLAKIQTSTPSYKAPKTPEELATFRQENPDAYGTIETIAHQMAQEGMKDVREKLERIEEREQKIAKKEASVKLKELQPDFETIKEMEEFHEWIPKQPQQIQDWLYRSLDANLASRAIEMFKVDTGYASPKSSPTKTEYVDPSLAAQAVNVATPTSTPKDGKKVWTKKEIESLSIDQYESLAGELDAAYREGRIAV